jgi:DNA-binding response OmpR family regulator
MIRKRVLICDDDQDILEVTKLILQAQGFEVSVHSECDDIINLVEIVKPDIILMDHRIPSLGGVTLAKMLKAHSDYRKIPLLIFSANSDIDKVVTDAGADGFLRKPFDIEEIVKILTVHLSQSGENPDL